MHFNEIGVNQGNLITYRFFCLKRQFAWLANTVQLKSKELSFWSINYVSGIKTKFLGYKIRFISIICTMLVRTLYGAEK